MSVGDPTLTNPYFSWNQFQFNMGAGGVVQFLGANPYRVGLIVWNSGQGDCWVSPSTPTNPPSNGYQGLHLNTDAKLEYYYYQIGALLTQAWTCYPNAGASTIDVQEISYKPPEP